MYAKTKNLKEGELEEGGQKAHTSRYEINEY